MIRACILALALLVAVSCGKYGPPVRAAGANPSDEFDEPEVQGAGDTEECPDPNAPAPDTRKAP